MNELKPCPFCGGESIVVGTIADIEFFDDRIGDSYEQTHYMACCAYNKGGCGAATGGWYETKEEAIAAWNRRVNDEIN